MSMKKAHSSRTDELRPEYQLLELQNAVRGKYHGRKDSGSSVVVLDPDVARAFPSSEAVNDALRLLVSVARAKVGAHRRKRRRSA